MVTLSFNKRPTSAPVSAVGCWRRVSYGRQHICLLTTDGFPTPLTPGEGHT